MRRRFLETSNKKREILAYQVALNYNTKIDEVGNDLVYPSSYYLTGRVSYSNQLPFPDGNLLFNGIENRSAFSVFYSELKRTYTISEVLDKYGSIEFLSKVRLNPDVDKTFYLTFKEWNTNHIINNNDFKIIIYAYSGTSSAFRVAVRMGNYYGIGQDVVNYQDSNQEHLTLRIRFRKVDSSTIRCLLWNSGQLLYTKDIMNADFLNILKTKELRYPACFLGNDTYGCGLNDFAVIAGDAYPETESNYDGYLLRYDEL